MFVKVASINGLPQRLRHHAIHPEAECVLIPFLLTLRQHNALIACQGAGISASHHSDDVSLFYLSERCLIERHVTPSGTLSAWKTTEAGRRILQVCRIAEDDYMAQQSERRASRPVRVPDNLIQLPMQRSG